jgi:hypothetical protein
MNNLALAWEAPAIVATTDRRTSILARRAVARK